MMMETPNRLCRKILDFRPDAVLTAGMLEELDNFPHEILGLFYQDYCDGIVTGLEFRSENGGIVLGPGLVRFQGAFYILPENVDLSALMAAWLEKNPSSGKSWNIVLARTGGEIIRGVPVEYLGFEFAGEPGDNVEKLQIAGFRDGLKTLLPELAGPDAVESFLSASRLQLLDTPMAAKGEASFVPSVFLAAKNLLMAKKWKSAQDLSLLFRLTEFPCLSMDTVKTYIRIMGGKVPEDRKGIFREFFRCLAIESPPVCAPPAKEAEPETRQAASSSVWI